MSDTQVGPILANLAAKRLRVHRTTLAVDVCTIGLGPEGDDLGPQFLEDHRRGLVRGAMTAIHNDTHAFECQCLGKRRLGLFHITSNSVLYADRLADLIGGGPNRFNLVAED